MNTIEIAGYIKEQTPGFDYRRGMILGSGLGAFAERELEVVHRIPYERIPGFPQSTVSGHAGNLLFGKVNGVPLVCMQGRFHYYEGYDPETITLPIRVFRELGMETLILTNASGGINPEFQAGDLMVIRDHINFMGINPLRGENVDAHGPRFPDMTGAWDRELGDGLVEAGKACGVGVKDGIYIAVGGPSFETPAEIRAFQTLGADAVGMSTVPECIVARQSGMRVCGLSCITNLAAGLGDRPLTHEEVGETAKRVEGDIASLFRTFFARFG